MKNITVKEAIKRAKNGDLEAKSQLLNHYYNRFYNYLKLNGDIENLNEEYSEFLFSIIEKCLSKEKISYEITEIIQSELSTFFKSRNDRITGRTMSKPRLESLIEEATYSKEAKAKLIKRYMYLPQAYLEYINLGDIYSKEDALQDGYLLLIERINEYLEKYKLKKTPPQKPSDYLSTYLNSCFIKTYMPGIVLENENANRFHDIDMKDSYYEVFDDLTSQIAYIEFIDYVNKLKIKEIDKEIILNLLNNSLKDTAKITNLSYANVSYRTLKVKEKIKKFVK